jgi:hypothetical protein
MVRKGSLLIAFILIGLSGVVVGLENTFGEAALGYTIDYPANWVVERPSDFTVRFGGATGPASRVAFAIQNVASTSIGGQYASVGELLDALKCQLVSGAEDICLYTGESITVVDASGRTLVGPQIVAEYAYDGGVYKEWLAVVPHSSGNVFYVLTYTAPQDDYDRFEPTALEMVSTWTIGGTPTGSTPPPTSSPTSPGRIIVLLEDRGHVGPYDYGAGSYDKRFYDVVITTRGYLAIAVVDEAGESISGWVYTPAGAELVHKPGNFAEIYTDAYEVFPGTYQIKVGQDTMVTESDFALYVYFSSSPFGIGDLEAAFGSRYRTMP